MHKLITSATILLFLFFVSVSSAQDQSGIKLLTIIDNPIVEAPIGIDVYLYGKKIKSGEPFKADDNWLEDLQIALTNKTEDDITFVSLVLDFPTEHDGVPMAKRFKINYGRDEFLKLEQDPDVEERKIGKKASTIATFNSNGPLRFESFKQFKKNSPYDPKIWDRGELFVHTVEFGNRAWYQGWDYDKKADGIWEKNTEKEKKLLRRIEKALAEQKEPESKIGFFKRYLSKPVSQPQGCFIDRCIDRFPSSEV